MQLPDSLMPRRRAWRISAWVIAVALLGIAGGYAMWRAGARERWAELDREWVLVMEGALPLCPNDPELDAELARLLLRAEEPGKGELAERLEGPPGVV